METDPKFVNQTDLEFSDISTEAKRIYRFAGEEEVVIENPLKLHVSDSGGHRIFDKDGNSHYIPDKWIHLKWEAKENAPHFVK